MFRKSTSPLRSLIYCFQFPPSCFQLFEIFWHAFFNPQSRISLVPLYSRLEAPHIMLHRASKHTSKLDAYRYWQKSFDALYLPWLCPSLYGSASSRPRKTSTIASARLSPHPTPCRSTLFKTNVHGSKKGRGLASAVGADYVTSQDHYIPFEASGKTPYADADLGRGWLRPITSPLPPVASVTPTFDPDSALIIHESLIAQPQRFRAVNAISGEVVEILQTLRACVQVDRLERAATLMRRLNEIYKPNALELVKAHNDYLRELVQKLRHSKDPRILKRIHKWFEVDLRGIGVVPDATTYALMIQAALQESSYKKVDRTVRRYMFLADEAGVRHNVMQVLLLMFSEQDIGRITEVCTIYVDRSANLTKNRLLPLSPSLLLPQ